MAIFNGKIRCSKCTEHKPLDEFSAGQVRDGSLGDNAAGVRRALVYLEKSEK